MILQSRLKTKNTSRKKDTSINNLIPVTDPLLTTSEVKGLERGGGRVVS